MADRRPAPPRNPRSDAEEVRLCPAWAGGWSGQDCDFRRQQCQALRHPAETRDARIERRPFRRDEDRVREERAGAEQHPLWLRDPERAGRLLAVCLKESFRPPKPPCFGGRLLKSVRERECLAPT